MEHRALSPYVGLVRDNALATYLGLVSAVNGSQVSTEHGFTLVRGPGPFSFCNFAAGFNLDPLRVQETVAMLKQQSDECGSFYVFSISGDTPDNLEQQLVSHGFEVRQRLTSMATQDVIGERGTARLITDHAERVSVATFMARQFFWSMPNEARSAIAAATAACGHTLWCVGSPADPEAAVMLVERGGAVGLFNLCVKPDLRGKGIGRGLVGAVLAAAKAQGLPVVLQCGDELVGWYSSLGFEPVGSIAALTVADTGPGDILI